MINWEIKYGDSNLSYVDCQFPMFPLYHLKSLPWWLRSLTNIYWESLTLAVTLPAFPYLTKARRFCSLCFKGWSILEEEDLWPSSWEMRFKGLVVSHSMWLWRTLYLRGLCFLIWKMGDLTWMTWKIAFSWSFLSWEVLILTISK